MITAFFMISRDSKEKQTYFIFLNEDKNKYQAAKIANCPMLTGEFRKMSYESTGIIEVWATLQATLRHFVI